MDRRAIRFRLRVHNLYVSNYQRASFCRLVRRVNVFRMLVDRFFKEIRLGVSPITIQFPSVIFRSGTSTTVLARGHNALYVVRVRLQLKVIIRIRRIATDVVIATAYQVRRANQIVLFHPFNCLCHLRLPPNFIRQCPYASAQVEMRAVRCFLPFLIVVNFKFNKTFRFYSIRVTTILPFQVAIATQRVLPCSSARAIAVYMPAYQFRLSVLTGRVRARVFHLLCVVRRDLIYKDYVRSIKPPALIRQSGLRRDLIV